MKCDLVSVIIPAYNTGDYLENIITAIKSQSYHNIEVIVIDDGSTDNTVVIAEKLLANCMFSNNIISTKNGGVSAARNLGISVAKGDWVICLDSDDYIVPNMIERLLSAAVENDTLCAFCDYKTTNIQNITEGQKYDKGVSVYSQKEIRQKYLDRSIIWVMPATLLHRSLISTIKYDNDCPYSEDTLYTWELIFQIRKVVYVRSDLYNYLVRDGSKQHSLTSTKCLQSIVQYKKMVNRLYDENNSDGLFISFILPKFILGAFHVLSRCVSFNEFQNTRHNVSINRLKLLIKSRDIRLITYAMLFRFFPRIFYGISK